MDRDVRCHRLAPAWTSRRRVLLWGLVTAAAAAPSAALAARAASFAGIDSDRNGAIDLEEAKRAASTLFDRLDRNRTGKLSRAALGRRRVSLAQFSWADRDHDGTLTKDEYLALVEREFRAADPDGHGSVSRAKFMSRAALPLRRLLY